MSILNVNQIQPVGGGNTITVSASDVSASGATITATSFVGPLTGAVILDDSISHIGDTNTKIRFPAADTITAETGGSERLRITSDGKFGLGLTPSMFFEVYSQNENDIARFSGPNSGNIVFRNDTSNEIQIHTGTSDALIFGTNGENERLRITSAGNIGINSTSPGFPLVVQADGNRNSIQIINAGSGTEEGRLYWYASDASTIRGAISGQENGLIFFAGGATERLRITSSGQFLLGSTTSAHSAYKLESYSGGAYNIMARSTNGNGGYHNFTGQASNGTITSYISHNGRGYFEDGVKFDSSGEVLDTYEQGTFDPTISAVTSGSITLNGGYNTLSYTKIGRIVHISGQIRVSSVSSPVGNTLITNLPFTAQSTTEQGRAGSACFYYDASAGSGNYYKTVSIHVTEGTTILNILTLHSLGGITVAANDELAFAFSYIAAS